MFLYFMMAMEFVIISFTDVMAASAATPETALELAKSTEHPL